MTCKTNPLATQGNAFLEGVPRVIVVTVALVAQRKCLAATKSPTLTAASPCSRSYEKCSHETLGYSR